MKKIFVTDIKLSEPFKDEDFVKLIRHDMPQFVPSSKPAEDIKITKELVQGKRIRRGDVDFLIGWSKEVQVALGLPFEVFDGQEHTIMMQDRDILKQQKQLKSTYNQIGELQQKLFNIKEMGFWKRFKFLFTGRSYLNEV